MKTLWFFSCMALLLQAVPQSSTTGAVQGTIVRAGSAEPMGDVQVRLLSGLPPGLPPQIQLQLSPGRAAVSDNMGRFLFRDVPVGRYTLLVQREGFSGSSANTSLVTVSAGKTSEVSLTLIPGAIIRGRVLDSTGQFLSNVTVQAFSMVYQNGMPSLQPGVSKTTDDRGEYRLFGVPPGDYYVGVTPRAPIANTAPSSGTVRNVRTFHPSTTTTASATRVTLNSGDEISGIDIAVQSRLQVLVSGRVVSEVPPPPPNTDAPGVFATIANTQNNSANLVLAPRDASVAEDPGTRGNAVLLNASQGEFRIPNVVAGSYDLFAIVNSAQGFALGRTPVDVIDRDITGITVVVRPGVEVKAAMVVNGNVGNSPNLRVGLQPMDGLIRVAGGIGTQFQTAETRTFSFPSVPEGRFRVTAATFGNLYIEDILQNGMSIYDSGFEVHFGSSPDPLQVLVKSGAGAVEGAVADAAGKPLAGATVALVPGMRRTNVNLYRNATSDAAGKFNINGVAPGEYKLFAWPGAINGAYFNAEFLARYEDQGRAITVTPDSRINAAVSAFHGEGR